MKALLVLPVAGLIAFLVVQHGHKRKEESRFGAIASAVAGRPVGVRCEGLTHSLVDVTAEEGSVWFDGDGKPADHTDLKRRICASLDRYARLRPKPVDGRSAVALNTLAHESYHLAGIQNEAVAECYSLQATAYVARRLGAGPEEARALVLYVLRHVYPQLPDEYRTSDCRDGGPLDLHRGTASWP